MQSPPPIPPSSPYTSCYCEENVYLLCQKFISDPVISKSWKVFVIFISNEQKTVALYSQKASHSPDVPVVWDYHVILLLETRTESENQMETYRFVYDFDTTLTVPSPWEDYLSSTFLHGLPVQYESNFRVIPGETYLKHFASDRSHMLIPPKSDNEIAPLDEGSLRDITTYQSPPPFYPPIQGTAAIEAGITHNLMSHYVDMVHHQDGSGTYGLVLSRDEIDNFRL